MSTIPARSSSMTSTSSTTSSKMNTRLTLAGSLHKAYKVMLHLCNPALLKDSKIPLKIIREAKGIAFVTVVRAGFIWSGQVGSGCVMARLPNGDWSGPSSVGVGGMGWGALVGAQVTDSVIILNTDAALKAFSGSGNVKLGGSLSVAAGPIGREADGSAVVGNVAAAACYSYSHSRGLFAGISLQGAVMMTRSDDNAKFYGAPCKAVDILAGKVAPPANDDLTKLHAILAAVSNADATVENLALIKAGAGYSGSLSRSQDFESAGNYGGSGAWGPAYQAPSDDEDESIFGQAAAATEVPGTVLASQAAARASQPSPPLPAGWQKVSTPGSEDYYWNPDLGKTQWERPQPATLPRVPDPGPPPARTGAYAPPQRVNSLSKTSSWASTGSAPPVIPPRAGELRGDSSSLPSARVYVPTASSSSQSAEAVPVARPYVPPRPAPGIPPRPESSTRARPAAPAPPAAAKNPFEDF